MASRRLRWESFMWITKRPKYRERRRWSLIRKSCSLTTFRTATNSSWIPSELQRKSLAGRRFLLAVPSVIRSITHAMSNPNLFFFSSVCLFCWKRDAYIACCQKCNECNHKCEQTITSWPILQPISSTWRGEKREERRRCINATAISKYVKSTRNRIDDADHPKEILSAYYLTRVTPQWCLAIRLTDGSRSYFPASPHFTRKHILKKHKKEDRRACRVLLAIQTSTRTSYSHTIHIKRTGRKKESVIIIPLWRLARQ